MCLRQIWCLQNFVEIQQDFEACLSKIRMEKHKCKSLVTRLSILMAWEHTKISAVNSQTLVVLYADVIKIGGEDTYECISLYNISFPVCLFITLT